MSFSQFSLRGLAKVKAEWDLVCLCHNLRKLYRLRLNKGLSGNGYLPAAPSIADGRMNLRLDVVLSGRDR